MLTGDEAMTTGHAYIDGYNVKTETKQVTNAYSPVTFFVVKAINQVEI